ncbi:MAG: 50S ribosomal protein L9 [Phycisphaerales bacterium]|nr:MAG: 50S ribosomal protein L9 [Phycisphaerales bacterium]
MKLLLCKNIDKLGIVGDVVEVAPGYARNYLLPQGLATEPTDAARRALAEARRIAEEDRTRKRAELEELAKRLEDVEVTIRARANEEGVLYGSVGTRDVSDSLADEEYFVSPDQIMLERPIRHLDTVPVEVRLAEDLTSTIKVWVVRERPLEDEEENSQEVDEAPAGREAGANDDHTDG